MTAGLPPPAPGEGTGRCPPAPAGLVLAPFRALRFSAAAIHAAGNDLAPLTCPPYDVIDDEERRRLEGANPHNVVHLILPRGPADGPDSRYRLAARLLAQWRSAGLLAADRNRALYVYEEDDGTHRQRGLLGALALAAPDAGIVLPHEDTMAGPIADRLALTEATQTNLEPIFLVYDGGGAASAAVASAGETAPLVVTTTADGITHRLWAIDDPGQLASIAGDLHARRAIIADGHHRYATYLQHQADRHAAAAGPGPWDFGLAYLVDSSAFGPQVQPVHRVIPGLSPQEAASRAGQAFVVRPLDTSEAEALEALARAGKAGPAFLLGGDGAWRLLTEPSPAALARVVPAERSPAWQGLDVTVAHTLLIRELWGCPDTEEVVGYRHDVPATLAAARCTGGTALLLNPTPIEAVLAVAAAGERLPRKSTLFTPKPRTGLAFRAFADNP